jgi:hypothetical protein
MTPRDVASLEWLLDEEVLVEPVPAIVAEADCGAFAFITGQSFPGANGNDVIVEPETAVELEKVFEQTPEPVFAVLPVVRFWVVSENLEVSALQKM